MTRSPYAIQNLDINKCQLTSQLCHQHINHKHSSQSIDNVHHAEISCTMKLLLLLLLYGVVLFWETVPHLHLGEAFWKRQGFLSPEIGDLER